MNINTIMNFIGWIFTILGLPSAIGFIHTKIKNRKNISWRKIMKQGIVALSKKVETIKPDYIVTFSGRGSIVCSLVVSELDNKYPVYMCLLKRRYNNEFISPLNWTSFETAKWRIFVPDEVLNFKDKKILIIDDITDSGETIEKLINHLVDSGISRQNLYSMALIANNDVLLKSRIPQEYWKSVDMSEYNVPWGKTKIM